MEYEMTTQCCRCRRVLGADGEYREGEIPVGEWRISHGYCPTCRDAELRKIDEYYLGDENGTREPNAAGFAGSAGSGEDRRIPGAQDGGAGSPEDHLPTEASEASDPD